MVMVRVLRLLPCRPGAELPAVAVVPRGRGCRARPVHGLPVGLGKLGAGGGVKGLQEPRAAGELGEGGHGLGGGH